LKQRGVCRDFARLAITLCRCMNIPARYCTGYLGDIGVPASPAPMDFSARFEVYLDGAWRTFDARHNRPRIGRILWPATATPPTQPLRQASERRVSPASPL
jgi:transglutaminase-like putative cysteine protease